MCSELDFGRYRSLRQLRTRADQRENVPESEGQLSKSAQFSFVQSAQLSSDIDTNIAQHEFVGTTPAIWLSATASRT